jgi:toxin FitB
VVETATIKFVPDIDRQPRLTGALSDLARSRGQFPGFADIAIAATARRYDLTVLSRNERHFAPIDVAVVDPFRTLP